MPRNGRLPELGARGWGWVAIQAALIVAILISARAGLGWPERLETAAYVVGGVLMALGSLLLVAGGLRLGASLTPLPKPHEGNRLTTTGVYALARHPMYGGGLLFALGWSIAFASVAGAVLWLVLVAFVELKSRREEQWLAERHPDYAEYRQRTPRRFIPFVY
ncbi:MAG TPA: isoprenylcysteine carboxylmethyltransferase family protein [Gaiellaceae bacterium]|nr:isoprenylcysteine carboxylmethyltransferase family protein [Gaiellaceae bacterium]